MEKDKLDVLLDEFEVRLQSRQAEKTAEAEEQARINKIAELETKVAKLEGTSVEGDDNKGTGITVGTPDIYKGFQFKRQFSMYPEYAPKDEKTKDQVTKEMIDVLALCKTAGRNVPLEKAAMNTTTDAALIPETWTAHITEKQREASVAYPDCRKEPIINGKLNIPKQGNSVTLTWANEEAASSQSEPTSAENELTAKKVGLWGKISRELLEDAAYDVVGYITRDVIEALGQEIDNQVFNGSQFTGLLGAITTHAITFGSANTATTYADMVARNFFEATWAVSKIKRQGAKWYLAKELLPYIAAVTTGVGAVRIMNETVSTICGYPYTEVESISGVDATSSDFISFGSLQNYVIGMKLMPNSIELNPWSSTEFKQYQVMFRLYARMAGTPIFEDLFSKLKTA